MTSPDLGYYLGLPAWNFPGWQGRYFPRRGRDGTSLRHYARVFNTVEGNTTFYQIPGPDTIARGGAAVAGTGFRFSFKLPRSVTHDRHANLTDLEAFLQAVTPLEEYMGPLLVQCPASLGPAGLPELEAVINQLPAGWPRAVEVRHPAFFERPELLEPLLERTGAARVMFDSRPIYQGDTGHPEVLAARHKKPDVPLLDTVYGGLVYARVVLHPDPESNARFVTQWLERVAGYLSAGHSVYFMMHCPNNMHCPAYAAEFHEALAARCAGLALLPPWPLPQQQALF